MTGFTPSLAKIVSKALVILASRSPHAPGPHLHDEQHVDTLEEDRAGMEEVTGKQAVCLGAREARQEVSTFRGAGLCRRARRIRRTVASLMR